MMHKVACLNDALSLHFNRWDEIYSSLAHCLWVTCLSWIAPVTLRTWRWILVQVLTLTWSHRRRQLMRRWKRDIFQLLSSLSLSLSFSFSPQLLLTMSQALPLLLLSLFFLTFFSWFLSCIVSHTRKAALCVQCFHWNWLNSSHLTV